MEATKGFPQGFFFIRCKSQEFAVDVNGGSMTNDANIIIWPQKLVDSINQLWMHEEGFLINKKSGLVLDIRGGNIERDKVIIQYARKPGLAHNQRWTYQDGFIFPTSAPHLVLDIRNAEFKNGTTVYLNTKNLHSKTQQWLIQPFENEKSVNELALLRPSPLQRTSTFPRQEELYDCYRMVYLEPEQTASVTPEQLAGAAAFKAMKDFIEQHTHSHQDPIVADDQSRPALLDLVKREVIQALNSKHVERNLQELVQSSISVSEAYFSREYSVN